jgi:GT2 family glycosyltransferase
MTDINPSQYESIPNNNEPQKWDSPPTVAVIILNWNNYKDTAACLRSLIKVTYSSMEVYVADNGSTDGSGKKLAAEFPEHEVVFNQENLGFAAGCNSAIDRALNDDIDYVLLLNNDAEATHNFLSPLVETAETHADVAIVGGVIRSPDGEIQSAGGNFNPILTTLRHRTNVPDTVDEVEFVSGAMMLIDANFLREQGGLDESYFFGMEDQVLCWLARRNGFSIMIDPRSEIVHQKGGTAGQHNPFRYYHNTYNRVTFARRHLAVPSQILFVLFFATSRVYRYIQWIASGSADAVSASLLAFRDILLSHPPRRPEEF